MANLLRPPWEGLPHAEQGAKCPPGPSLPRPPHCLRRGKAELSVGGFRLEPSEDRTGRWGELGGGHETSGALGRAPQIPGGGGSPGILEWGLSGQGARVGGRAHPVWGRSPAHSPAVTLPQFFPGPSADTCWQGAEEGRSIRPCLGGAARQAAGPTGGARLLETPLPWTSLPRSPPPLPRELPTPLFVLLPIHAPAGRPAAAHNLGMLFCPGANGLPRGPWASPPSPCLSPGPVAQCQHPHEAPPPPA